MSKQNINPAGWLAQVFVSSKLTLLFMLASVLLGVLAVSLTPREENPQIIVPAAEIFVTFPGASAKEVEQLVVNPLEAIMSELTGVDHVYSVAMNSLAIVTVQFKVGEDKEMSLVKLYDRVMGHWHRISKDASQPLVKSIDVDDVPVLTVTLASEKYDDYALKRLADRMSERLRSIKEVSVTYVQGGNDREVRIEINPERLQAFDISLNQIHNMIKGNNLAAPLGNTVKNGVVSSLYLDGFLTSVDELKNLIIGAHNGRPIYLTDIATVIDKPSVERDKISRFAFGPADARFGTTHDSEISAVTLAVAKKAGTNAVLVVDDVLDRVKRMEKNFIPKDVHLVVTRNDGKKADQAVNNLIEHLGIAIFSVFIVIVLFLGFKEALIVGITVPLILALTLGADYIFGFTINRVTLFALILSLGLLVDAAIVVIENIHRHYKHLGNKDKSAVTVLATNEIGNPTNLATLAVVLVFGSLMVVSGMMGQYFNPVTFNVPVAMLASLLVAYIVTPWAANRWLKPGEGHDLEDPVPEDRLHTIYHKVISPLLDSPRFRRNVFLGIIVLMILSILQPAWQFVRPQGISGPVSSGGVALALLPKDNKNTFNITIDMPENTPIERTDQITRELGDLLRKKSYVTNYQSWVGQAGVIDFNGLLRGSGNKQGSYVAEIRVNLTDKAERDISSIILVRDLRAEVEAIEKRYSGSTVKLLEDPPGPPVRATVLAEIYGTDPIKLRKISDRVTEEFRKTYDMVEVQDTQTEDVVQYRLVVDKEKAALSGVTAGQVAQSIRRLISGDELGRMHIPGEKNSVPIRLHVPREYEINHLELSRIFIHNNAGQKIPLSEMVKVITAAQDRPIMHKDNEQVTYVGGELKQSAPAYAVIDLDNRIDGMDIGDGDTLKTGNLKFNPEAPDTIDGYKLLWEGEIRLTLDTFRDMGKAMGVALAFIYLLLVAYYRSFSIPLVAMSAIPLGLIGVFPGHWIMGQSFSATSMIGVIALSGVVVRNSLLIIDFVLDYMKSGMSLREAVSEAGAVRLRPILLTAFAIVLGSAVMLVDPVFGGLAISLIFGTIVATVLTLLVVPALLYLLLNAQQSKGEK
ncbi:MAG: efflux RND transporter permease subunit [Woeseiaceae bacterium]